MANYPKNLAARVYAFLTRSGARIPDPGVLDQLFQILYFASLKTEEAEPISCRVAFADRHDPDPNPPSRVTQDRWQCFALERDLPCTVRNLVKLSKAVDPWSSTLAVDFDSTALLRIWGVIDQGVHHSTFVVQETESGPRMPGLFQATIEGIGEVAAYKDHEFLGRLRQDVLVTREVGVLQSGPIREKLLPAIHEFQRKAKESVGAALYEERGHWASRSSQIHQKTEGSRHCRSLARFWIRCSQKRVKPKSARYQGLWKSPKPPWSLWSSRSYGVISQGEVVTPEPDAVAHAPLDPGPNGQFHQFSVASMVAVLSSSTPIALPLKLLRCTFICPEGAENATSIAS